MMYVGGRRVFAFFFTRLVGLLFPSLILLSLHGKAQAISNEGRDFWLCFPSHTPLASNNSVSLAEISVFITAKSNSSGKILFRGGSKNFTVAANTVTEVKLPRGSTYISDGTGISQEMGIHVVVDSDQPRVVVYGHVFAGARSAATLVLPVEALGQQYYAMAYNQGTTEGLSQFQVIAVDGVVHFKVTPVGAPAFSITLQKAGDVYQYQSAHDVTGAIIEVDKNLSPCNRIAVFSGSSATYIRRPGCNATTVDPLIQQLYPIESWGKSYALVPFYNRLEGSIFRVMAAEDNTQITLMGANHVLNKGEFYTTDPSYQVDILTSDKPISVAQYSLSQQCGFGELNDPDMVMLNPLEYSIKDVTMYSAVKQNIQEQYLNVVIPTTKASTFLLNNQPYPGTFTPFPDAPELSYTQFELTGKGTEFTLTAQAGFNAIAYGFGHNESYAYSAGTSLASTKVIQVLQASDEQEVTKACLSTGYHFKVTLPYAVSTLKLNTGDGEPEEEINNLVPQIITSGSQLLYVYHLNVEKLYTTSGTKQISVTAVPPAASNTCFSSGNDILTYDLEVEELPLAAFEYKMPACLASPVDFKFLPQTGKNITGWDWDFGDGNTSTEMNPSHIYASARDYTVRLIVTSSAGCSSVVSEQIISIFPAPEADFEFTAPGCQTKPIQFIDKSEVKSGQIVKWEWDFGDGSVLNTDASPGHVYANAGAYQVRLTCYSEAECSSTITKTVTIHALPVVSFSFPVACASDNVQFTAADPSGEIVFWEWDFGDGSAVTVDNHVQNPGHQFPAAGNYEVTLRTRTADGCYPEEIKQNIAINSENFIPDFEILNANSLCSNQDVLFKNKSTIGVGKITRLEWLITEGLNNLPPLVDNDPEPGEIYSYSFPLVAMPKTYQIVLRAYSGQSCVKETDPVSINMNLLPTIYFDEVAPLCEADAPIALSAGEVNHFPGTGIFTGSGINAKQAFDPALAGLGSHTITYSFTTNSGCTETITRTIQVFPVPVIDAGPDWDLLIGGEVKLEASIIKGAELEYIWFPEAGLSNPKELLPTASPLITTTYRLLALSPSGCQAIDEVTVKVHDDLRIPNAFSPNGDGKNDTWSLQYINTWTKADIRIYNRYGQLVFYAQPYTSPWDGKNNTQDVAEGVYYYIIEPNNGQPRRTGSITLVR